jgi:phosphonate transport system substrate-binding protein
MALIARRRFVLNGLATLASSAALAACAPAAPATPTPAPKPVEVTKPPGAAPTAAAAPAATAQPTSAAQTKLSLALVPSENAQEQARQWGDYFKWLEKRLDVKIENFVATDYTAVIEAMRARHIEAAWFGPFSYILAAQEATADAIAVPANAAGGKTYHSYFIARIEAGIDKLEDIKGKTFSFGDPASTSGHLIPRYNLKKAGIDPEKDFKSLVFSGGHDATGLAVFNQKVDAGAIWDGAYHRLAEKKLIDEAKMKIVSKSDPIPEGPWAARKDMEAGLRKRFADALQAVGTEAPELLKAGGYAKFVPVADADYDLIRETAKALNLDVKKLK